MILKKEDLCTGMIVLSDIDLYRGFKENLTIPKPFLILHIVKGVGFSKEGIEITYLSPRGEVNKFAITLNYNFVVL